MLLSLKVNAGTEVSYCEVGPSEVGVGNLQVDRKRNGSPICAMSELHQLQGIAVSVVRIACFFFHFFLCLAREEQSVLGKFVVAAQSLW